MRKESAVSAKLLDGSVLKGRQITVMPKRKNKPGMGRGGFGGRGRGAMNMMQGILRGMMRGMGMRGGGFGRGMGRGFRGRGRGAPMDRQNSNATNGGDAGDN